MGLNYDGKDLYIWGITNFAKMIFIYLNELNITVKGFIVDKKYITEDNMKIYSVPVISWEDFRGDPLNSYIIPAIGYNNMNTGRKIVFDKIHSAGFKIGSFIHKSAVISSGVSFGEGNIILENSVIQPNVQIGNGNVIWSNVNICHDTVIGNMNFFAAGSTVLGLVNVSNYCFIGSGSIIRNRIYVGERTLVGAGSYISEHTEKESVYVPVRSVRLNKKSYEIKL
ncbi:MAG: acetyltransferase [Eubacterium sp.]|nr:acetyltransferase [Eubacterium sp.]